MGRSGAPVADHDPVHHPRDNCRIVITGIGLCTPLGPDRESSWRQLLKGVSAVRWLGAPHWIGDTVVAGAPVHLPTNRPFRHSEPLIELALTTASEAVADAGLTVGSLRVQSAGVVYGASKGGLHTFQHLFDRFRSTDAATSECEENSQHAGQWLDVFPNQPAAAIRRLVGGDGPLLCPISACATGLAACLRGAELIRNGDCELVLAGSADISLQPALIGSFRRLGVLSRELNDPSAACRPFDRHRSGFVIGEGAACLVLESLQSAQSRQANVYAEWLGGGMLSDPHGLTQLDPRGTSLKRLLQDLRAIAGRAPDCINLHGTGTTSNDLIECRAIHEVFGEGVADIDCSSLKGGMGHLLGAAGSVELAAAALSIRDQVVPPTVNLVEIDPECRLRLTPGKAKPRRIEDAWKLSLGFGGHLAGACLRKRNGFG